MTLPGEGEIMDMMKVADPDAVHSVRSFIRKQLASELKEELLNTVKYLLFPVWSVVYLFFLCFFYLVVMCYRSKTTEVRRSTNLTI